MALALHTLALHMQLGALTRDLISVLKPNFSLKGPAICVGF